MSVIRLGHLGIVAQNYQTMLDYYTGVLGFELSDQTADTSYLRIGGDYHTVALHRHGREPGLQSVAFQIGPEHDLTDVVKDLSDAGVAAQIETDVDPSVHELVSFCDRGGGRIELYSTVNHPPRVQQQFAIAPRKLGHVARGVVDVKEVCAYYEACLGFRVSDWIGDFFVFMRCGPDHHTVNFIKAPTPFLHHIAYEVCDWAHIQRALDILAGHRIRLIRGPMRHGVGHNVSIYHLDPDGNPIELFCELDTMLDERLGYFEPRAWHEDNPQRPKVWKSDEYRTGDIWGGARESFSPKMIAAAADSEEQTAGSDKSA